MSIYNFSHHVKQFAQKSEVHFVSYRLVELQGIYGVYISMAKNEKVINFYYYFIIFQQINLFKCINMYYISMFVWYCADGGREQICSLFVCLFEFGGSKQTCLSDNACMSAASQ
eukprot:TRINITY_DN4238_c1_g1_i1.p6 TRINITY_DN4238_c1_g1~~TRINITY_DN4238_c1_g1_i1.p6  ORF type:complete len:114 (+),score=8.12 TRINITY_DN4238_c1_g1_i1:233-574(+)